MGNLYKDSSGRVVVADPQEAKAFGWTPVNSSGQPQPSPQPTQQDLYNQGLQNLKEQGGGVAVTSNSVMVVKGESQPQQTEQEARTDTRTGYYVKSSQGVYVPVSKGTAELIERNSNISYAYQFQQSIITPEKYVSPRDYGTSDTMTSTYNPEPKKAPSTRPLGEIQETAWNYLKPVSLAEEQNWLIEHGVQPNFLTNLGYASRELIKGATVTFIASIPMALNLGMDIIDTGKEEAKTFLQGDFQNVGGTINKNFNLALVGFSTQIQEYPAWTGGAIIGQTLFWRTAQAVATRTTGTNEYEVTHLKDVEYLRTQEGESYLKLNTFSYKTSGKPDVPKTIDFIRFGLEQRVTETSGTYKYVISAVKGVPTNEVAGSGIPQYIITSTKALGEIVKSRFSEASKWSMGGDIYEVITSGKGQAYVVGQSLHGNTLAQVDYGFTTSWESGKLVPVEFPKSWKPTVMKGEGGSTPLSKHFPPIDTTKPDTSVPIDTGGAGALEFIKGSGQAVENQINPVVISVKDVTSYPVFFTYYYDPSLVAGVSAGEDSRVTTLQPSLKDVIVNVENPQKETSEVAQLPNFRFRNTTLQATSQPEMSAQVISPALKFGEIQAQRVAPAMRVNLKQDFKMEAQNVDLTEKEFKFDFSRRNNREEFLRKFWSPRRRISRGKAGFKVELPVSDLYNIDRSIGKYGKATLPRSRSAVREFNIRLRTEGVFLRFPTAEQLKRRRR